MRRLRAIFWLRVWRYTRKRALDAVDDAYYSEMADAWVTFDYVLFGGRRFGKTRVLNAASHLRNDYVLHDAAQDLL